MAGYLITEPAQEDILGIWTEIAKNNEAAADGVVRDLVGHFETLANSPRIGRIREAFSPVLHVFPSFKAGWRSTYMIFYRITERGIEIIRVLEGHREITPELFE